MSSNTKFYGLLHIAENENSSVQLQSQTIAAQFEIYVKNAVTLSASLKACGFQFTLLTNAASDIEAIIKYYGLDPIELDEIEFTRDVPSGIRFYSAHFKLDVFRYLASKPNQYSILCDLDMVCTGRKIKSFTAAVARQIPLYYNISDQVWNASNPDVAFDDIQMIQGDSDGVWCGGEFIGGNCDFFSKLADVVDEVFPQYIKVLDLVSHVGDEAVTSAALQRLRRDGICMIDAGALGIIGRFWNCARFIPYARSAEFYESCFLIHMPADKKFLARLSRKKNVDYRKELYRHCSFSIASFTMFIKRIVHRLVGGKCGVK